ncbi:NineTeen Complex (NTC) component [Paramarasmius palmivorus]|uniref:NineTeen Complex (NTC) component n=1 Tax=Paramarasmius palmivorus TaxID=297713 RepID=A0AAW0ATY1_9AGAR
MPVGFPSLSTRRLPPISCSLLISGSRDKKSYFTRHSRGSKAEEYRGRSLKKESGAAQAACEQWLQYANWEASQNEFGRSRWVCERALDVDPRNIQLWLGYAELELEFWNVQNARNLLDKAVTLLPRVDQLWYRYVYVEELLENAPGARQVFERWMQWEPDDKAWEAYIKMEERYGEMDRASAIYERWATIRPEPRVASAV